MEHTFSLRFVNVDRKLIKRFKFLNKKKKYGVYEIRKLIKYVQLNIEREVSLSIEISNKLNGQILEFGDIIVKPFDLDFELLDVINRQSIAAGDLLDGPKLYMEINRQYNDELKQLSGVKPRQLIQNNKRKSLFK